MKANKLVVSGKNLIKILERAGFDVVRINGSHHRMKHADGRVTTIPVHKNDDLPIGLLRKIVREDLQIEMNEFEKLIKTKNDLQFPLTKKHSPQELTVLFFSERLCQW